MNLIQKIFGTRQKGTPFASYINGQNLMPVIRIVNTPIYGKVDPESGFRKAFAENATYFAVLDRIAEKFGHIPRYVYKEEKQAKKKQFRSKALDENVVDGELSQLLLNPNDNQGQDQFFYLCCLSYKATGECFIWKNRGGIEGGKPLELYVIPPWLIAPISDGTMFGIGSYELTVAGNKITFPAEDIIHWKKPALALGIDGMHLRGFNPMVPQRKLLTQVDSITDASVAMYQQGGAKGILYNKDLTNITDEQREQIQGVIDKKINNNDKRGSVASVQGEWGYLNIGLNSVDMALVEADDTVSKKICFALGFPPELYIMPTAFNNKEQAWQFFITNTLMPMCASFDGELNRSLRPDFKDRGRIVSDFSDLPEMQTMRLNQVDAISKLWQLTPNQVLNYIGEEPSTEPAMDKVYIPSGFVPIDEISIGQPMDNTNANDF